MRLQQRIGCYSVTAKIGEGGMGEVYRARDTKLDRDVALKVLPEAFTEDPDRLARFQREAKVLASLNHPNIGGIHGLEDSGDVRALVLELIEGPTLADRIKRGPIPVDETLPIAKQIAEALEAAHEAGVIHRDLKPANIKVRPDGTVKVLDFGLAKAIDTAPEGDPNESPTLTAAGTQMGVIMGTAAYMSPEQARGKPVDKRADIWAFGVVLYEMLAGHQAFDGETLSDTLASILDREPDWEALPVDASAPLRRLLYRCLDKDARERLQHVGDVRVEIRDLIVAPRPESGSTARPTTSTRWGRTTVVAGLAALAASVVTIGLVSLEGDPRWQPLLQSDAEERDPAISPDGQWIAYSSNESGEQEIYVQRFPQLGQRQRVSTSGGANPRWSPSGVELFYARGTTPFAVSFRMDGEVGSPQVVYEGAHPLDSFTGGFSDIAPDGRFLILGETPGTDEASAPVAEIVFVQEWSRHLERLVPTQ